MGILTDGIPVKNLYRLLFNTLLSVMQYGNPSFYENPEGNPIQILGM